MTDKFYPEIPEGAVWALGIVKQHLIENPDYLSDPECPYDEDVLKFFGAGMPMVTTELIADSEDEEVHDLEGETSRLYTELKAFGVALQAGDTSEKNTYFRLSVSLLEKLLDLKERTIGVKQVTEFTNTVLTIMEDELTPDIRTKIVHRLKSILGR